MSINANINVATNTLQTSRNLQTEYVIASETNMNVQPVDKMQKNLTKEEINQLTSEMTNFMQLINSDIQFQLHEKTKQLIVQVVDMRDGTVLKEFPPHELLDTMAKIREYVGILLDKKA